MTSFPVTCVRVRYRSCICLKCVPPHRLDGVAVQSMRILLVWDQVWYHSPSFSRSFWGRSPSFSLGFQYGSDGNASLMDGWLRASEAMKLGDKSGVTWIGSIVMDRRCHARD